MQSTQFSAEETDPEQDAGSDSHLHSRIESGRSHSVSSLQTTMCAQWMNIRTTMNNRFMQWVTICSAAVRQLALRVTTCFLRFRKTSKGITFTDTARTYEESGFSNTVDVGQFFRTRPVGDAHGRRIAPCCEYFTRPRSIEGSM